MMESGMGSRKDDGLEGRSYAQPSAGMPEYAEEVFGFCKKLRLSHAFAERATAKGEVGNLAYLHDLLREEVSYRRDVRVGKLLKASGIPNRYNPAEFDPSQVCFPDGVTYESLVGLEFFSEDPARRKNIVMLGKPGTGMTMLSCIIGQKACERGIRTAFFRTASLVARLNAYKKEGGLEEFREGLMKASVFIFDEFGYVPYDRTGSLLLFDLMSEIHNDNSKVVILNTGLKFMDWPGVLCDERIAASLSGRLLERCHVVMFGGEDMRLKGFGTKGGKAAK